MAQTSRERVTRTLKFEHPDRLARELWCLPWAHQHHPETVKALEQRYPGDFGWCGNVYRPSARQRGEAYAVGTYVDPWGCIFTNIQSGVHGEVKQPLIADIGDWRAVRPPYEMLPANIAAARDEVNRNCAKTDKFVRAGCCPRPWEQYQFLRGSENAFLDVMEPDSGTRQMLKLIQDFYMKELEFWVRTDVDAINFMDDWGSQRQLLIPPRVWRDLFKPLYKQFCDLAHANGKFVFMHSDGFIEDIYPDLVEIGVDALNSQVFCMDMSKLARIAKGKLTFWGEIDRQHVLPETPDVGRQAVRTFCQHFFDPAGGVIAQFEFSPGANPETALVLFDEWEKVHSEGLQIAAH